MLSEYSELLPNCVETMTANSIDFYSSFEFSLFSKSEFEFSNFFEFKFGKNTKFFEFRPTET